MGWVSDFCISKKVNIDKMSENHSKLIRFFLKRKKKGHKNCRPCRHKNNNLRENLHQKIGGKFEKKIWGKNGENPISILRFGILYEIVNSFVWLAIKVEIF